MDWKSSSGPSVRLEGKTGKLMASIGSDSNGRKRILFVAPDGSRKTVRLGKASQRDAEQICRHVEALVGSSINGQPLQRETAVWLQGIADTLHDRLARTGLIKAREVIGAHKLGATLTGLVAGRNDLKSSTKLVRSQVVTDLKNYFGEMRDVRTIHAGDAEDFKQALIKKKLAPTTIHKRLQNARQFFKALVRRKIIEENPFAEVALAAAGGRDRLRFITRDEISSVLDACPNDDWRCIVALSRYGGLRCPSEVLSLRWSDIDWAQNRMTVHSPKTEHLADKAKRVVPLFPELRPILLEAKGRAPTDAVYVVDERFRKSAIGPAGWRNVNLRTTFEKIVKKAGLKQWPRLFHNLRASRETELVEDFPIHVVTQWLGNTPDVALGHYLMTTEEHFSAAVSAGEVAEKAAQNPAQQLHAGGRKQSQMSLLEIKNPANCGAFQTFASGCEQTATISIAGGGFEPPTSGL